MPLSSDRAPRLRRLARESHGLLAGYGHRARHRPWHRFSERGVVADLGIQSVARLAIIDQGSGALKRSTVALYLAMVCDLIFDG